MFVHFAGTMKPGDNSKKTKDIHKSSNTPLSPTTPMDDASSSQQPWNAKFQYEAFTRDYTRRNQILDTTLERIMERLDHLSARDPVPPAVTQPNKPVRPNVPVWPPAIVQRRQPPVQENEYEVQGEYMGEADFGAEIEAEYEPPQRSDQPRLPPPRRAVRAVPRRFGETDSLLNNIKTSIPEFGGLHNPDMYLDWERKVNKIFECYDFPELKKVQLASLEFRGYTASWWENQQERRCRDRYLPIDTWQEMKDVMRGRFIPVHYERELEKKLNRIKQGTRSIEEYHKELEISLNRARKKKTLNATIIRYIEGMNPDIACEVELRDFSSIEGMVHYASIVERQLRDGRR